VWKFLNKKQKRTQCIRDQLASKVNRSKCPYNNQSYYNYLLILLRTLFRWVKKKWCKVQNFFCDSQNFELNSDFVVSDSCLSFNTVSNKSNLVRDVNGRDTHSLGLKGSNNDVNSIWAKGSTSVVASRPDISRIISQNSFIRLRTRSTHELLSIIIPNVSM